jgi:calcineurin-like phosphoesterase family protein
MIWFTSDWHLDHANILDFEKQRRKLSKKISQFNDIIIKRCNEKVKPEDTLYFLGDLSLRNSDNWPWYKRKLDKTNGSKHLILGNHDKLNPFLYVDCGFLSVHTALFVEEFCCMHDPAISVALPEDQWCLCGHVHSVFRWATGRKVLNVGIDVNDYYPISIEQIRKEIENGACNLQSKD